MKNQGQTKKNIIKSLKLREQDLLKELTITNKNIINSFSRVDRKQDNKSLKFAIPELVSISNSWKRQDIMPMIEVEKQKCLPTIKDDPEF